MEKKAKWRFVPSDTGGDRYRKIAWKEGDRQTMAIHLFRDEGSNAQLPFGARFEKQLALAKRALVYGSV